MSGRCHNDGLMQERRNSIANALQLRLSCTNPSMRLRDTHLLSQVGLYGQTDIQSLLVCQVIEIKDRLSHSLFPTKNRGLVVEPDAKSGLQQLYTIVHRKQEVLDKNRAVGALADSGFLSSRGPREKLESGKDTRWAGQHGVKVKGLEETNSDAPCAFQEVNAENDLRLCGWGKQFCCIDAVLSGPFPKLKWETRLAELYHGQRGPGEGVTLTARADFVHLWHKVLRESFFPEHLLVTDGRCEARVLLVLCDGTLLGGHDTQGQYHRGTLPTTIWSLWSLLRATPAHTSSGQPMKSRLPVACVIHRVRGPHAGHSP